MATRTRLVLAVAAAGLVAVPAVVTAATAQAASYRYWTYWTAAAGSWSFASTGPAYRIPADGSVEGWRFAVSSESGGERPRTDPATAFATLCADTAAEPGRKRVAVVIDTGEATDAPPGESPPAARGACVVADPAATGYAVLRATSSVRTDDGLICAIDGYPARECAVVASDDVGAADAEASTEPTPAPTRSSARPQRSAPPTTAGGGSSGSGGSGGSAAADGAEPAAGGREDEGGGSGADPATGAASATTPEPAPPLATAATTAGPQPPVAEESPVALVTAAAPPPPASGSPLALVLVALGAGALGLAAWLRTRGRRA